MEDRQFKGIWIPKEIWITDELSLQEKVVLVEIDSLDDEEKGCYASNKYFADFFKLTNGRISQIIKQLQTKGYLDISYNYNGKEITERLIKVKRPPYPEVFNKLNRYLENDDRGIKKIKQGYLENAKENNITTNNININNMKEIYKERFKKPTLEEVEAYCKERGNKVNPKKFYDFYETGNWKDSKGNQVKNWKQKVITWEKETPNKKQQDFDVSVFFDDKEELKRYGIQ